MLCKYLGVVVCHVTESWTQSHDDPVSGDPFTFSLIAIGDSTQQHENVDVVENGQTYALKTTRVSANGQNFDIATHFVRFQLDYATISLRNQASGARSHARRDSRAGGTR